VWLLVLYHCWYHRWWVVAASWLLLINAIACLAAPRNCYDALDSSFRDVKRHTWAGHLQQPSVAYIHMRSANVSLPGCLTLCFTNCFMCCLQLSASAAVACFVLSLPLCPVCAGCNAWVCIWTVCVGLCFVNVCMCVCVPAFFFPLLRLPTCMPASLHSAFSCTATPSLCC